MKISFLIVCAGRGQAGNLHARLFEIGPWVDETVIVVDGEPDAATEAELAAAVATSGAVKVVRAPYEGYCEPQRARGLAECTGDWVLVGDTDEQFRPTFRTGLRSLVQSAEQDGYDGLMLVRLEFNLPSGPLTRHPRLFRRGRAYFTDLIHTNVQGLRRVKELPGYHFTHFSATDGPDAKQEAVLEKKRRYAAIQARLREKYAGRPEILRGLQVDYGV